jgi:hypothetical protein
MNVYLTTSRWLVVLRLDGVQRLDLQSGRVLIDECLLHREDGDQGFALTPSMVSKRLDLQRGRIAVVTICISTTEEVEMEG